MTKVTECNLSFSDYTCRLWYNSCFSVCHPFSPRFFTERHHCLWRCEFRSALMWMRQLKSMFDNQCNLTLLLKKKNHMLYWNSIWSSNFYKFLFTVLFIVHIHQFIAIVFYLLLLVISQLAACGLGSCHVFPHWKSYLAGLYCHCMSTYDHIYTFLVDCGSGLWQQLQFCT